jgi:hypothetical protein
MIKVKLKSRSKYHYCLLYVTKLSVVEEVFGDLCHAALSVLLHERSEW